MEEVTEWEIPTLDLTIRKGDTFLVGEESQKITSILTASDQLGVYACYPHLNGKMNTLIQFVDKVRSGEIKSLSQVREDKINKII